MDVQKEGATVDSSSNEFNSIELTSSTQLIKILKDVEHEMQSMHAKLNDMNDIGEQIGSQLSNSPALTNSINVKMDTLEAKWNSLLEQMEYLSKVCTEQQQLELAKTATQRLATSASVSKEPPKKRRLQAHEIKEYTSIDVFVSHLNKLFEKITTLVNADHADLNPDEQQEVVKRADLEIRQNEDLLENMQMIAQHLMHDMKTSEQDTSELETLVKTMNAKWTETSESSNSFELKICFS